MNIQTINANHPRTVPANRINFGNTVNPTTIAEKTQRILRDMYHDASYDGRRTKIKYTLPRMGVAESALNAVFRLMVFKENVAVNDDIRFKLMEFYAKAFSDGENWIDMGWANATQARRQIADILEGNGFKETADELRINVNDNLHGDY